MRTDEKKFQGAVFLDGWEIESVDGYHPVIAVYKTVPYNVWIIKTKDGFLECADDHIVFDENRHEVFAKDLRKGQKIVTENGISEVLSVEKTDKKEPMYDVQVSSEEHSYLTNGILSHNTTVSVVFILHYILFNKDKSVVLLAHKGSQAREILSRLKLAYSLLPKWMQVGIVEWNKGSIVLENGSSVIAAATSSNTIRGMSFSCVFLDECVSGESLVTIRNKKTGEIMDVSMQELWDLKDSD